MLPRDLSLLCETLFERSLDVQDEATMTVSQILGTYRKPHDNLHQELEDGAGSQPVMDYTAHASLEKRRSLPELDESGDDWPSP